MEKIIIVAKSENNVIGKDRKIPWDYPEDIKHFRKTTTGFPVIMGRKTYQSLPENYRPLPDRENIVLTRSNLELPEEVYKAESLEEAWNIAENTGKNKVFVIGGASIYKQTLDEVDKLIITRIHEEYEGDTFFPEINFDNWKEVEKEKHSNLSFITYERV